MYLCLLITLYHSAYASVLVSVRRSVLLRLCTCTCHPSSVKEFCKDSNIKMGLSTVRTISSERGSPQAQFSNLAPVPCSCIRGIYGAPSLSTHPPTPSPIWSIPPNRTPFITLLLLLLGSEVTRASVAPAIRSERCQNA